MHPKQTANTDQTYLANGSFTTSASKDTLTMPSLKIKRISISVALFFTSFFYLGFIGFAAIFIAFFLYRIAKHSVNTNNIRRAGIPELSAVFLLGLFSTATLSPYPFSMWNVGKDIYFFLAPIMMLIMGLSFLRDSSDFERVLKTAAYTLTIISILQFSDFLLGGDIFGVSLENRYNYRMDSTAASLALILIICLKPNFKSLLGSAQLSAAAILNLLLIVISLSRVNLAITLIALVFVYSHSKILRTATFAAIIFLTAAPLLQIPVFTPVGAASDNPSFFSKLLGSLQEYRISDYSDFVAVNENWRGYEAFLGIEQVTNVGGAANIIGVGFGSFAIGPFEGKLEEIPFFHNGFVTIFLKSGALGIGIFSLFLARLYVISRATFVMGRTVSDPRIVNAGILIFILTSSIVFRTLTTHGVYYSRTLIELFFIGLSIYFISDLRRAILEAKRRRKDDIHLGVPMLLRAGQQ